MFYLDPKVLKLLFDTKTTQIIQQFTKIQLRVGTIFFNIHTTFLCDRSNRTQVIIACLKALLLEN